MLSLGNKLTLNTQPIYHFVNKYSIDFDGVDDCIITDGADTVAQNTTYSFWSKSSTTTENKIFGHGGIQIGSFWFNSAGNLYPLLFVSANHFARWENNPAQDDGEWHHWVLYQDVNNAANCKLYCDGILQTQNLNASGSLTTYTESLTIGGTKASGGSYFEGKIDEFAVFDRELTQEEITRMYNTYYSPNRVANGNFSQIGNEEVTNGDFSEIGSELVVNGDFASDTTWTKETGWTISGGTANYSGGSSNRNIRQAIGITNGKTYKIQYQVTAITSGEVACRFGGMSGVNEITATTTGTYVGYITANSSANGELLIEDNDNNFNGRITNVSVKEVGQDWSLVGDFEIDDTKAFITSASQYSQLTQQIGVNFLTSGKSYKLEADITTSITNALAYRVTGGAIVPIATSDIVDGKYTAYFTMSSNGYLWFQTTGAYTGLNATIDNLSVKEVGQNWGVTGTDSTHYVNFTSSGARFVAGTTSPVTSLFQNVLISGRTYKLTCNIAYESGSGNLRCNIGGVNQAPFTEGFNTRNQVTGSSAFSFLRDAANVNCTISNVVIQELKHDATNLMLNAGAYQSANPLITSTNSMEFDGIDDYLNAGVLPDVFRNAFTISAWIFTDTSSGNHQILSTGQGAFAQLFQNSTNLIIQIIGASTYTKTVTNYFTTDYQNKWVFLNIVYNGSTVKAYRNGIEVNSDVLTGTLNTITGNFNIGRWIGNSEFWNGKITELGLYDRALTSLEVTSLYNQGMPTNLLVNRNNYQSGNPTVFNTKQVDFDGTDDYMNVGVLPNSFTTAFTVSAWVWTDAGSGAYQIISTGQGAFSQIYQIGTGLKLDIGGGTNYNAVIDADYFDTAHQNTWVYLALVYNGATIKAYRNGIEVGSAALSGTLNSISQEANIGRYHGGSEYWNGKMSQIGLFSSALTADEVSSLYNHGLPIDLTTNQAAYTSSSNLVGYWRMGSGTLDSYPLIADQTNATLGSELVTNGDFELNSGWLNFGSPTTSEQSTEQSHTGTYSWKIIADATQEGIFSPNNFNLTSGLTYSVSLWIYSVSGNSIKSGLTNTNVSVFAERTVTVGEWTNITYIATASSTGAAYISILSQNSLNFFVDDVSIKQVNGNPAIMTNQTASDIENGSPYANQVQNNNFDTDTLWNKEAGWTISGGKLIANTSSVTACYQVGGATPIISGKTYKVQFEITDYTNGSVNLRAGTTGAIVNFSTIGVHSTTMVAGGAMQIRFASTGVTSLSIDNVTVEEVNTGLQGYWKMGSGTNDEYPVIYDQTNPTLGSELVVNGDFSSDSDWTKGTGWTISGGKLVGTNVSTQFTQQSLTFTSGKLYKVSFDITGADTLLNDSAFRYPYDGAVGNIKYLPKDSPNGTYTNTFTSSGSSILYLGYIDAGTFTGTVDNVTVKELQGNPATMTNMVEGNITNQYPLTKIRNYYRMGDGILDGYPIIQDQTSPNLAHIPTTNVILYSNDFSNSQWQKLSGSSIGNRVISPDGTLNGWEIIFDGTTSGRIEQARTGMSSGENYSVSVFARVSSGTQIVEFGSVTTATYTLNTQWQKLTRMEAENDTISYSRIVCNDSATIEIFGFQLEEQSQATAYLKSDGIAAVRKATTTNLITYSEDFSQSAWVKASMNFVSNIAISPDGTLNATSLTNTNTTQSHTRTSFVTATTGIYTGSAYLKKQDFDFVYVEFGNSYAWFNISNGTLGNTGNFGSGWTFVSHSIESVGNDWYRISITANNTTTGTYNFRPYQPTSSNGSYNSGSTGTSFIWGTQVEQQTQVETYAKTTGLPVTIDLFTENNYGTMTNMSASDIIEDTPNN